MQRRQDYIHLKSPGNWINDPNGFIYFHGKYHMFYQHFPYAPVWGTMHWGHAISDDLVHWEHQDIAIYPTKQYDMNGVFSGNAIEIDGKMYLYYTGIRYLAPNPENIHLAINGDFAASQVLLVSEDGEEFDNLNHKECVILPSSDYEMMSSVDTRDPKVWFHDGKYYMILGSAYYGEGRIIILTSVDGRVWEQQKQYHSREFGTIFECPDLFELDGKQIMFCAATEYLQDGLQYEAQEIYKFVHFDYDSCELTWDEKSAYLDYGMDLYATQTNLDADGNRVMIAWMRMPEPMVDAERGSWSGIMSMPRVMHIRDNHLYFQPHPNVVEQYSIAVSKELLGVRKDDNQIDDNQIENIIESIRIEGVSDNCYTLARSRENDKAYRISIDLADASQEAEAMRIDIHGYVIRFVDDCVQVDRTKVYPKGEYRTLLSTPSLSIPSFSTPSFSNRRKLDIYIDEQMVEIYVNDGEYVLSNVIYH